MLYLKAEWPSKQNILITDTILAEPGLQPEFKVWRGKIHFCGGKNLIFIICLKQIFLSTTKCGKHKKGLRVTAPECPTVSAGLGRTVARKSSIGGLHVCTGELDILRIYF